MSAYGGLEALARYPVPDAPEWLGELKLVGRTTAQDDDGPKPDDVLGRLFRDKVQCLSDILCSIEAEARSRQQLSTVLLLEIQRQYCYLKTKLFELYDRGLGINRALDTRRSKLEIQLDKLNEESRLERVRAWQDVERLATEWRTWFKQHGDLVERLRIVGVPVKSRQVLALSSIVFGGG